MPLRRAGVNAGGSISFADRVVAYEPAFGGGNVPSHPNFTDPAKILGSPDYEQTGNRPPGSVSLGSGGRITVEFTNNVLTGSGDSAEDLHIFEVGVLVEDTFVEISKDGETWHDVGKVFGSTSSIDIDAFGFDSSDAFRFVRLRDDPDENATTGDTVGADMDAIGAIASVGQGFSDWVVLQGFANANDALPEADPNNDGVSNLLAYALGLKGVGFNEDDSALPEVRYVEAEGEVYPAMVFARPGADGSRSDITYECQSSMAIGGWTGNGLVETVSAVDQNGKEIVTARLGAPLSGVERYFFRLRVTLSAP